MAGAIERGLARFALPGVLLGVAIGWGTGFLGDRAEARQAPGARRTAAAGVAGRTTRGQAPPGQRAAGNVATSEASDGGTLAIVADPEGPAQWLYLIDTRRKSFAVYRVEPGNPKGAVKLEASRDYRWDLELDEYNNQGLAPSDVEARVQALTRAATTTH